jgi:hypothetical protein
MKSKYSILILGLFLIVGTLSSVYGFSFFNKGANDISGSSLNKGLVGHWVLDNESYNSNTVRMTDKTPYENHCTNYGVGFTTDRVGNSVSAMDFGASYYMTCGNDDSLKILGDQTYAFWIYPNAFTARRNPIDKAYGGEGTITLETNARFSYYWGTGGGNLQPYQGQGSNVSISANRWTHVAHVRDITNNKMVWYFDGVPAGTTTPSYAQAVASSRVFSIGDGYCSPIDGYMDDVRVYNRALSAEEIKSLFGSQESKMSSSSLKKGLILDVPLKSRYTKSEVAGSEVMTDRTPYSQDGTNYGAVVGSDYSSFDGSNDYVKIEDVIVTSPSELTIAGWIKKESGGSNYECALHHGNGASVGASAYWFGVDASDYLTATIGARTGVGWSAGKTTTLATYGEWYHLAAAWDGAIVRVYINGEYDKQYNLGTYSSLITATRMGSSNDGTTYQFKGDISDVKIYNRGLSSSEIKSLYDRGRN